MITTLLETDTKKQLELEEKFKEIFINNDIKRDFQNNPYTNYLIYLIDDKIVGFINYLLSFI